MGSHPKPTYNKHTDNTAAKASRTIPRILISTKWGKHNQTLHHHTVCFVTYGYRTLHTSSLAHMCSYVFTRAHTADCSGSVEPTIARESFIHNPRSNISNKESFVSRFSSNSEANSSELLEILENIFPQCYMYSYVFSRFKSSTTQ